MEYTRANLADLGSIFCDSLEVFDIPSKLSEHLKNFHDSTNNQYWMDKDVICIGLASELDDE